jgi:hypothetical protein
MASVLVFLLVVVVFGGTALYAVRRGGVSTLDEARADADHWYDLLGGQVLNLTVTANETVKQAVGDASERYNTAGAQRATAQTVAAYRSVRDTSLEGLHFIRAARTAMGFDPGPDLPPTSAQFQAGQLRDTQRFSTPDGQTIEGRPQPTADNRFYYPGGIVGGRGMPGGWYNQPFWKGALLGSVAAFGGTMLLSGIADAIGGGFGDGGGGGDGGWGGDNDWSGGDW